MRVQGGLFDGECRQDLGVLLPLRRSDAGRALDAYDLAFVNADTRVPGVNYLELSATTIVSGAVRR